MAPSMEEFFKKVQQRVEEGENPFPAWVLAVMACVFIVYVIYQTAITYGYGSVVATLAMVEDIYPAAIIRPTPDGESPPPYTDDPNDKRGASREEEILLVTPKPVTSSNKGTIKHLQRIGGKAAIFRGLGVALFYGSLTHWLGNLCRHLLGGAASGTVACAVAFVASQTGLWRLNMLWTHIVISAPSSKPWYRRFTSPASSKKLLLPTMAWASVHVAIPAVLVNLIRALRLDHDLRSAPVDQWDQETSAVVLAKTVVVAAAALLLMVVLYVPANVALTRCQAAQLAEDEEPVVPFDRSFGGLVAPDGPGLKMRDAWTSFDWNSRVRLAKVYIRTAWALLKMTIILVLDVVLVMVLWYLLDRQGIEM